MKKIDRSEGLEALVRKDGYIVIDGKESSVTRLRRATLTYDWDRGEGAAQQFLNAEIKNRLAALRGTGERYVPMTCEEMSAALEAATAGAKAAATHQQAEAVMGKAKARAAAEAEAKSSAPDAAMLAALTNAIFGAGCAERVTQSAYEFNPAMAEHFKGTAHSAGGFDWARAKWKGAAPDAAAGEARAFAKLREHLFVHHVPVAVEGFYQGCGDPKPSPLTARQQQFANATAASFFATLRGDPESTFDTGHGAVAARAFLKSQQH